MALYSVIAIRDSDKGVNQLPQFERSSIQNRTGLLTASSASVRGECKKGDTLSNNTIIADSSERVKRNRGAGACQIGGQSAARPSTGRMLGCCQTPLPQN
jgi:hypothetical protein